MNAVTQTTASENSVAALQSLRQGLANVASVIVPSSGDPFLKLTKSGRWFYGAENSVVEPGSEWAVNPVSLKYGFVSWTRYPEDDKRGNTIEGEVMVPMTSAYPDRAALPDTGWDWAQQFSFQLRCVSGEDEGEQTMYKSSSKGCADAVNDLVNAIRDQIDRDIAHPVPVVVLESTSYMHKKYGETYKPHFKIVRWVSMTGVEPVVEKRKAPEPVKAVRTRTAKVPAAAAPTAAAPADEDDELVALEAELAARKAAKVAAEAITSPAELAAAVARAERKAALMAQMAELEGGAVSSPAPTVPGQPIRRRRQS